MIVGAWLCMGGHLTDLKNIAEVKEAKMKKNMHDRKLGDLFTQ
jgi:hypothetical protein